MTPGSASAPAKSVFFFDLTADSGRKVTLPSLLVLRYSMISLAVSCVSVTTFCILPPRAVSIAVSYFLSVEIRSASAPCTPLFLSSMTLRVALP